MCLEATLLNSKGSMSVITESSIGQCWSRPSVSRHSVWFIFNPQWQPTPVFLPGKSHGQEEPGGLQSMVSQRVRHDWATDTFFFLSSLITSICFINNNTNNSKCYSHVFQHWFYPLDHLLQTLWLDIPLHSWMRKRTKNSYLVSLNFFGK